MGEGCARRGNSGPRAHREDEATGGSSPTGEEESVPDHRHSRPGSVSLRRQACQRAEEAGVFCFGQDADMSQFAQKAHLTGIVNNWGPYYIQRVQDVLDGTWETDHTWDGISGGLVMLAPYNDALPDDVKTAATNVEQALKDGTLNNLKIMLLKDLKMVQDGLIIQLIEIFI